MILEPYRGQHSLLTPYKWEGDRGFFPWRVAKDTARAKGIGELAKHLSESGILVAAGPVLSGALFAQALEDMAPKGSDLCSAYLGKPGYKAERHEPRRSYVKSPWVFVDDLVCSGRSMARAARGRKSLPVAVIFFAMERNMDTSDVLPAKWRDVPVMFLRAA